MNLQHTPRDGLRHDPGLHILHDICVRLGNHRSLEVVDAALAWPTSGNHRGGGLEFLADAARRLGFHAEVLDTVPSSWPDDHDGALVCAAGARLVALARCDGRETTLPDGASLTIDEVRTSGHVLHIRALPERDASALSLAEIRGRLRRGMRETFLLSLAINLCALSVPFFTMAVYDRVLGAGARGSLKALVIGAAIVVTALLLLRTVRSRFLASEKARVSASIGLAVSNRLLRQGFATLSRSTADRLAGRIRRAEWAADVFAAQNTVPIYDAPFVVLTMIALLLVGGILAVVPILYIILFIAAGFMIGSTTAAPDPETTRLAAERQSRLSDIAGRPGEILRQGSARRWLVRFDHLTRSIARTNFDAQLRSGALQAVGAVLGTGTALVTLVVGLELAISGAITPGALIAIMLLVWRVTGPVQALFLAVPRLRMIRDGTAALATELQRPTLSQDAHAQVPFPRIAPGITAENLYYRYDPGDLPALSGISFAVPAGSILAVIGPNGSGKSSLMRMLAGVVASQSGQLRIAGKAVSSYDPDDMALRMVYLPAGAPITPETDGEAATFSSLHEVADETRSWDAVIASDAPYYVIDDPLAMAGASVRQKIVDFLDDRRGRATVVFSTHDAALVPHADYAIVLRHGSLFRFGPIEPPSEPEAATPVGEVTE